VRARLSTFRWFPGRESPETRTAPLRLAVIGTPRSGNSWLRRLVATGLSIGGEDGREIAVHDPDAIDWAADVPRSIVQVHMRRDEGRSRLLERHGVRVLVPSRHPFDTLISILQYAIHAPQESAQWLLGEGGNEYGIRGLDPCHSGFLEYCRSERASALLGVSSSWLGEPSAVRVRYEDLSAATEATLDRVGRGIGQKPRIGWAESVEKNSKESLSGMFGPGHVWKGQPGLWRSLLTRNAASALLEAHGSLIEAQGVPAEADPELTPERALANWRSLTGR